MCQAQPAHPISMGLCSPARGCAPRRPAPRRPRAAALASAALGAAFGVLPVARLEGWPRSLWGAPCCRSARHVFSWLGATFCAPPAMPRRAPRPAARGRDALTRRQSANELRAKCRPCVDHQTRPADGSERRGRPSRALNLRRRDPDVERGLDRDECGSVGCAHYRRSL